MLSPLTVVVLTSYFLFVNNLSLYHNFIYVILTLPRKGMPNIVLQQFCNFCLFHFSFNNVFIIKSYYCIVVVSRWLPVIFNKHQQNSSSGTY